MHYINKFNVIIIIIIIKTIVSVLNSLEYCKIVNPVRIFIWCTVNNKSHRFIISMGLCDVTGVCSQVIATYMTWRVSSL